MPLLLLLPLPAYLCCCCACIIAIVRVTLLYLPCHAVRYIGVLLCLLFLPPRPRYYPYLVAFFFDWWVRITAWCRAFLPRLAFDVDSPLLRCCFDSADTLVVDYVVVDSALPHIATHTVAFITLVTCHAIYLLRWLRLRSRFVVVSRSYLWLIDYWLCCPCLFLLPLFCLYYVRSYQRLRSLIRSFLYYLCPHYHHTLPPFATHWLR